MRLAIKFFFLLVLTFQSFPSLAQETITAEEQRAAANLSAKFLEQWEADGKMRRVVSELYAPDFIERFIAQEKSALREEAPTASIMFLPGMHYQSDLLTTASTEDWRSFYVAAHGVFFSFATIAINQTAGPLLQGKEPDADQIDKMIERLIPASVRGELAQDPVLGNLVNDGADSATIANIEDLRRVTALLERTLEAIKHERGDNSFKLTQVAHKLLAKLTLTGTDKPVVEIHDEPFLGLPAGTRVVCVPIFEMFHLMFAKVDGEYRILCVHPLAD